MGMVRDIKVTGMEKAAISARDAGLPVVLMRVFFPQTAPDFSGKVPDVSEMLTTVENIGYRLDNMSYATDAKGRTCGYYLFRWLGGAPSPVPVR